MRQNLYANRPAMPLFPDLTTDEIEARTDEGIGAHRHGVRAGSIPGTDGMPAAMHSVAMGMTGGQGPLQFQQALDTAQAQIGNRALMNHVDRQYRQHAHQVAGEGLHDIPRAYPFLDRIQQAFGEQHDIGNLRAHTGTAARAANGRFGSSAYHKDGHVAFAGRPTLREAAHEAAHGVQQAALGDSLRLKGGIGQEGDVYERHADAVAQAVVEGRSAESLLDRVAGEPTKVTPGADSGNGPVQMMWPNLGRRALIPLMSESLSRPGVASQRRPGPGRNLSLSPRRNVWDEDILFGTDNTDTLRLAIKLEASTDSIIGKHMFGYFNKFAPPGFSDGHLWAKSGYGFADRKKLKRTDLPYMAYAREAIATAMERGGNIFWALGHLDFDKVFAELFRVETEYGTDPVRYMAEVSFPELMEKHGKYIDARTGEEVAVPMLNLSNPVEADLEAFQRFNERLKDGEIKDLATFQPLITTTEIIGFLMGDERKYLDRTSFFDARHQEADRGEFLAAFSGVLEQLQARREELGPDNEYKLEAPVYRSLDWYTGHPCGQCDEVFRVERELEDHWKSFPGHRP